LSKADAEKFFARLERDKWLVVMIVIIIYVIIIIILRTQGCTGGTCTPRARKKIGGLNLQE